MSYPVKFIFAVMFVALSGCASTDTVEPLSAGVQDASVSQDDSSPTVASAQADNLKDALPPIEPKADELLKQMGGFLASKREMSFLAIIIKEQVLPAGQKLQYDANVVVKMRRPDGLFAETVSGAKQKRFWYDGKTFSLLDFKYDLYATTEAPANIDDALDHVMEKYGVSMPLSDFVFADPYTVITENNISGFYVALTEVSGIKVHHLAFRQANVDWQIWIDAEGDRVPRKFVISYNNRTSIPQYIAFFKDWNFAPEFKADEFRFTPPEKAVKIGFSLEQEQLPEEVTE